MSRIFKEHGQAVFDPAYLPVLLPHREKEYNLLRDILISELRGEEFGIPILFGTSGTGKTTILRKVLKSIEKEFSGNIRCKHINATTHSKTYIAIRAITMEIVSIPERGYGLDEMILKLYDRLDIEELKYIVAIDDADELIRRDRGKVIDMLTRIEESYDRRLIYPVIVLRNIKILNGLPPHITSKLSGIRIEFSPYDKEQLKDIIDERIKYGIVENGVSQNAIEAAAFATEKIFIGNARELINIIFKAGKMAEALNDERITTEHVRNAIYEAYAKTTGIHLRKSEEERYYRVLWVLAKIVSSKPDTYKLSREIIKEAYEVYQSNFIDKLSFEDFTDIIIELSNTNINMISQDHGDIVFLSYPARRLYEILTKKLFL